MLSKKQNDMINAIQQDSKDNPLNVYPLTLIADRYGGSYSGGKFVAFNCDADEIPWEIESGDSECMIFWDKEENKQRAGVANTPMLAIVDLFYKLNLSSGAKN